MKQIAGLVSVLLYVTGGIAGDVTFNHFTSKPDIDKLSVPDQQSSFTVTVEDTCSGLFKYGAEPLAGPEQEERDRAKLTDFPGETDYLELFHDSRECEVKPHTFAVVHKPEYDGYRIHVTLPDERTKKVRAFRRAADVSDETIAEVFEKVFGPDGALEGNDPARLPVDTLNEHLKTLGEYKLLGNDEFVAAIRTSPWAFEFAAGPTVSDLTDRQYAIRNGVVVRDEAAEDTHKLGIAAFVHATNFKWSRNFSPVSLGFGISDSNDLNVFLGPSWRFGTFGKHTGYLTAGVNVGPTARLPVGQEVGQAPISENALNDLGTRTDTAAFVGVTFSFFGNARAALDKRFKDVGGEEQSENQE